MPKNKSMRILLIITIIIFGIIYVTGQTENQINTQYIILKKIKNIEIRDYKQSVNASYY